jgi:hypothetical protein
MEQVGTTKEKVWELADRNRDAIANTGELTSAITSLIPETVLSSMDVINIVAAFEADELSSD